MEDIPRVTVSQQLKALMHTSQQSKQKLAQISSALDNKPTSITKPIPNIQLTTTAILVRDEQVVFYVNTFNKYKT